MTMIQSIVDGQINFEKLLHSDIRHNREENIIAIFVSYWDLV